MKPANMLTVAEAIELINSDTRENPVVNNAKLISGTEHILANWRGVTTMNYTIYLVKRDESGQIVPNGKKWAVIENAREKQDLVNAITDHYKALSGRDVDPAQIGLRQLSTTIDKDVAGSAQGTAYLKKGDKLQFGQSLDSGSKVVEKY